MIYFYLKVFIYNKFIYILYKNVFNINYIKLLNIFIYIIIIIKL